MDGDHLHSTEAQYRTSNNLGARIRLHQQYSTNPYSWHRWVFDHFDLPDDARILEIGCGTGDLWHKNRDRLPDGWRITLTDASAGMVAEARQRLRSLGSRLRFGVIDATAIPFDNASFDGVIANHMLYHVPDVSETLAEIHRVLRPGGSLYAATNGLLHMQELNDVIDAYAGDVERDGLASRFGLENGAGLLAPRFEDVSLTVFPDSVEVPAADPVIAYIQSMQTTSQLTETQLDRIEEHIAGSIERFGSFRITKATGLFTCRTRE